MDFELSHEILSIAFGMIVGMSLGLTGGGGSIFALPLLTYGLGVPVGAALGVSLASVGASAGFGAALRLRAREIELQAGLIFSVMGMIVAPIGAMIGHRIAPAVLLSAFAVMMGYVGVRMWRQRKDAPSGLDLALPRAKENSPRVATPSSQFSAPLPDYFQDSLASGAGSPSGRYIADGDLSHIGFGCRRECSSRTTISGARHCSVSWRVLRWNARRKRPQLSAVQFGARKNIRCRDVARRRFHAGKKPLDVCAPLKKL